MAVAICNGERGSMVSHCAGRLQWLSFSKLLMLIRAGLGSELCHFEVGIKEDPNNIYTLRKRANIGYVLVLQVNEE